MNSYVNSQSDHPESVGESRGKLNKTIWAKLLLVGVSFFLFIFLSNLGFTQGKNFGLWLMWENFGEPRDLYPVLFAYVMLLFALVFSVVGIVITFIFMHQIGRRFKIAVGKPTFYGFLLYLLTVLRVIILDNLNKGH